MEQIQTTFSPSNGEWIFPLLPSQLFSLLSLTAFFFVSLYKKLGNKEKEKKKREENSCLKYTYKGLTRTLRMFDTCPFCVHQVFNKMFLASCVNTR